MTLIYRATKGSALTYTELDGNFADLDGRVAAFEGAASNPIDSIDVTGNVMTINYGTAFGGGSDNVVLPVAAWNFLGQWVGGISYSAMDVVSHGTGLFLVLIPHTSDSTFDPGVQIGGDDIYQTLLSASVGSTTASTLDDGTYTLGLLDDLSYFRCTSTGGCVITIPPSASVDVPLNAEITFRQCSDIVTFEADSTVTLNVPVGYYAATDHVGAVVTLKKVDTDEWDLFGALEQVTA